MKTGLHANDAGNAQKIVDYYARSGSKVFKALTMNDALFAQLKALDVVIIGRLYESRQRLGGEDAKRFLRRIRSSAVEHPLVDYWEGHNEAWAVASELERYATYEIERMQLLESLGRKAIIGNFAVGTPSDDALWALFMPACRHAAAHGHALGLHEYSGPYMQYMVETVDGKNQWDHRARQWTGVSADRSLYYDRELEGWLTLRYRKVHRLLEAAGVRDLPIFITEGGIDNVTPRPGGQGAGYKDFAGTEWARMAAVGDYAQQRRWYMWQASHDRYVKGVVDFGWDGTATGWGSFDMGNDADMVNRVIEAERDLPIGHYGDARPPSGTGIVPYPSVHRSPRGGLPVRWVVVHSTDSPTGSTPAGTARYLAQNDRQVSIHELVAPGVVYVMVADDVAAHHAGHSTLPDGTTGAAVNQVSWGIELFQLHGKATDPALVTVAVDRIAAACKRLGVPAENVVAHREIDPGRRSDPVGVDMDDLRRRVARALSVGGGLPTLDWARLASAVEAEHEARGLRLNPGSALQRAAAADGRAVTTNEIEVDGVVALRAEGPDGAWLYIWSAGGVHKRKL